jgi:hypothetical protein
MADGTIEGNKRPEIPICFHSQTIMARIQKQLELHCSSVAGQIQSGYGFRWTRA